MYMGVDFIGGKRPQNTMTSYKLHEMYYFNVTQIQLMTEKHE